MDASSRKKKNIFDFFFLLETHTSPVAGQSLPKCQVGTFLFIL